MFGFGESSVVIWNVSSSLISLQPCSRPVSQEGERVTPTDLLNHRANHDFRAPCCLCADVSSIHAAGYTESDIYIADNGPYSGEYVAGCASKSCGYLGNVTVFPET